MNAYKETINLANLRADSVEMLRDVKTIFDESGLVYWLDFGTLLGAVRHERTLYWDGDFDLSTLDPEMLRRDDIWDKVRKAGYEVLLSGTGEKELVKIFRKSNTVGQFRVDLHRYLKTPSGNAEFVVSYNKKGLIKFLFKIRNLFSIAMPPGSEQGVSYFRIKHFTSYHKICKSIMNAGIPPEELESLAAIQYSHGMLNNSMDFELKHPRFEIREYPLSSAGQGTKVAISILQKMPLWLLEMGRNLCEFPISLSTKTPDKISGIPLESVTDLETVMFHDMEFNCPRNVEDYLTITYGKNWRVPIHKWETATHFAGQNAN